jgi:hypothetical protein
LWFAKRKRREREGKVDEVTDMYLCTYLKPQMKELHLSLYDAVPVLPYLCLSSTPTAFLGRFTSQGIIPGAELDDVRGRSGTSVTSSRTPHPPFGEEL